MGNGTLPGLQKRGACRSCKAAGAGNSHHSSNCPANPIPCNAYSSEFVATQNLRTPPQPSRVTRHAKDTPSSSRTTLESCQAALLPGGAAKCCANGITGTRSPPHQAYGAPQSPGSITPHMPAAALSSATSLIGAPARAPPLTSKTDSLRGRLGVHKCMLIWQIPCGAWMWAAARWQLHRARESARACALV